MQTRNSNQNPISAGYAGPVITLTASVLLLLSAGAVPNVPKPTGEQIFKQQCAKCHGAKGEGSSAYKKALTGTRSAAELSSFIAKNMPPGAPKKLLADDAKTV